jgi:hypothetical protein
MSERRKKCDDQTDKRTNGQQVLFRFFVGIWENHFFFINLPLKLFNFNFMVFFLKNYFDSESWRKKFGWTGEKKIGVYKRNETKWKRNKTKSTKTKGNTMLDYFPHMSQCLSSGQDRIWSPLNKNNMHLFSGSLSFSLSGLDRYPWKGQVYDYTVKMSSQNIFFSPIQPNFFLQDSESK